MKVHNLLGFILILYGTTAPSSDYSALTDTRLGSSLTNLERRRPSIEDDLYRNLQEIDRLALRASLEISSRRTHVFQQTDEQEMFRGQLEVASGPHHHQRAENHNSRVFELESCLQPLPLVRSDQATVPINENADTTAISIPKNSENDYRLSGHKLSTRTQVAFAFLATFSLMRLVSDGMQLATYDSTNHTSREKPIWQIFTTVNDVACCIFLCALYKFNEHRLY